MDRLNKENEALKKENLTLKIQLAEHNKITELSATELQKLRLNLQSLYQQNLQLAQANSQMLAELSSGKDRLKALHHEVGCLKGVLNVKTMVLQDEKKVVDCQQTTSNKVPIIKHDAAGESSDAENTNIKRSSTNRRRQSKAQPAAKDTTEEKSENKRFTAMTTEEKSENKRLCLRRKSSRLASEQPACTDTLPKLDDVKPAVNAGTDKEKSVNKRPCLRRQPSRLKSPLMIKNIPNKYTSKMLMAAIDERHRGTYDFIYLPIDFKNKCNVGYAFINMIDPSTIVPFFETLNGKKWEKFNSEKVASLAYARIQGKTALIAHFQNSSLMNEDKRCRPILFHTDGPNAGDQVPFPMGVNVRTRPGKCRTEDNNHGSPTSFINKDDSSNPDSNFDSGKEE